MSDTQITEPTLKWVMFAPAGKEKIPYVGERRPMQAQLEAAWINMRTLLIGLNCNPDYLDAAVEATVQEEEGDLDFELTLVAYSDETSHGDKGSPNRTSINLHAMPEDGAVLWIVTCMEWQNDGGVMFWDLAGSEKKKQFVDAPTAAGAFNAAVLMMDRDNQGPKGKRK